MKTMHTFLLIALGASATPTIATAEEADKEFSSPVVDFGIVVSDIDRSIKFYTIALGLKKTGDFKVPAGFATDAGLTDQLPFDIVVLTTGDEEASTKVKLMQLPGVKSKKTDNTFIHSQLGVSYLTLHINSTDAAMQRLKAAGVKPVAKGPVGLPEPLPASLLLTVVRDPDGNLIELVGPK